jgi:cellulose synthase/poly-beta-1,6-N-acetylglucosamine synthase-like glycosyltransferase
MRMRKIAVLIPGYKEDEVIIEAASDALLQDYPAEMYDIVVIADSFRAETLEKLRHMPVKVIEVSFEKSTKAKALNKAMEHLDNSYEIAVVLDSDNLMAKNFLSMINLSFERGMVAVQGHRTAKNMNTSLAVLDAISEEINNHIFRKGHRVLGLSSAIIGSGMAFQYPLFREVMSEVKAVGGFDKEIELRLLKDGYTIEYLSNAYVFDEKVQKEDVFHNQRRRWLSAQLHYFRKDFINALADLLSKGNVDYFDKALQFIQPPRILLLGTVIIFGTAFLAINYLTKNSMVFSVIWGIVILLCLVSFLFSIPGQFYTIKTARALTSLPKGMVLMIRSLLKIKGANKSFLHTQHGNIDPEHK